MCRTRAPAAEFIEESENSRLGNSPTIPFVLLFWFITLSLLQQAGLVELEIEFAKKIAVIRFLLGFEPQLLVYPIGNSRHDRSITFILFKRHG